MAKTDPKSERPTTRSRGRPKGKVKRLKRYHDFSKPGETNFDSKAKVYPKAPRPVFIPIIGYQMWHKGILYRVGDIVNMVDFEQSIYFAQIRGFMKNQFGESAAAVTWLLPTVASCDPSDGFDPSTYLLGPSEDFPRDINHMEFVCHCPDSLYYQWMNPMNFHEIPSILRKPEFGYAVTSKGYRRVPLPAEEFNTDSE